MYKNIKYPINKEIMIFEKNFLKNFFQKNNSFFLNKIKNFIFKKKGKLIRPIIVFLIAKMLNNDKKIPKKTYKTAYLIQLIHTASIIHDDIVDNNDIRRGSLSVKKIWGNKLAVLFGDYIISKCLCLITKYKYNDLLKIISKVIKKITKGELLQIEKTKKLDITEKIYIKIIKYKTASLISACCEGGACSIGADKKILIKMKKLGELIGIIFQIKDDLIDYDVNKKNFGLDIKEKIITLPLIYALKNVKKNKKIKILKIIRNRNKNKKNFLINYVKKRGGVEYAIKRMYFFKKNALKILKKFPKNTSNKGIKNMIEYIINRNK